MKKIIIASLLLISYMGFSQSSGVGINATGTNPDPSAGLDVDFTDKGFLMPRMTTIQRDAIQNPAVGLQIFNLDSDCVEVYFGTGQWKFIQCGCNAAPNQPIGITGNIDVCLNQTGENYSVPLQNGISFYTWWSSEPNDVINGQGTNSVMVDFVGAGIRTLSVVANNSCGVSDTTVLVVDSNNPDATFTPLTGAINQNVNFAAQSYQGATYSWTFGQGTPATSTSQNPSVTWANQGLYAVSLTITDSVGCSNTVTDSISISTCTSGAITFNYTGAMEQWTVPNSCNGYITIETWGAEGGRGYMGSLLNNSGLGGYAKGDKNAVVGSTLYIFVGGKGNDGTSSAGGNGGWNGGGLGGSYANIYGGGGGGGASDVRLGGQTLNDRIIVGGGAGGGSYYVQATGGDGGYPNGSNGRQTSSGTFGPKNGNGGTQSAGGAGGTDTQAGSSTATSGTFGLGSNAGVGSCSGGGGGGWYGGGGGSGCNGGGGGGGSSYFGGMDSNTSSQNGVQSGNGKVTITW